MKLVLKLAGLLLAVIVVAAVAIPMLVDINEYKPQIQSAAESQTGRKLSIPGDIKLSVFPWAAVNLGAMQVGNAEGFSDEYMLEISDAAASLKLLPLLRGKIEVGTLTLHGLRLRLNIDKNGRTNWDDLIPAADAEPGKSAATKNTGSASSVDSLEIGGLDISDAAITFSNDKTGQSYAVTDLQLKTGSLKPGKPVDLALSLHTEATDPKLSIDLGLKTLFVLDLAAGTAKLDNLRLNINELSADGVLEAKDIRDAISWNGRLEINEFNLRRFLNTLGPGAPDTTDPEALQRVSGNVDVSGNNSSAKLSNLKFRLDDSTLKGNLTVKDFSTMALRFDLHIDEIDADRYIAPDPAKGDSKSASSSDPDKSSAETNATPVDLSALKGLDIKGGFKMDRLKIAGFELTNLVADTLLANGRATLAPLGLQLYEGKLNGSLVADSNGSQRIQIKQTLEALQFEPLTIAALGERKLAGTGDMKLDVVTSGKTVGQLKQSLNGTFNLSVKDGAVYGFDIGAALRNAKARIAGEPITAAAPGTAAKTPFNSLTGSGTLTNGLLGNQDLLLDAPDFRVKGRGTAHLYTEALKYDADVYSVANDKAADGQLVQKESARIPFEIRGTFSDPKVRVALENVAKDKAKVKVEEKKEELREKVRDKLMNNLFR